MGMIGIGPPPKAFDVAVVLDRAPGLPKQVDEAGLTKRRWPLLQSRRMGARAGRHAENTPLTVHAI